ncbi:MAG TPA: NAD(P)-dependent oxidoreductase [Bacteroidales bacterium]|nr:NAD(P)-dependent oxidoreductase [Bacteroidales bacterium]HRZ50265.1 NAD(P)-dependent oxidoreductase [Bacteroidales bacterium]
MRKILIATDKPFAASAVKSIRQVVDQSGYELRLLEGYTQKQELLEAVKEAEAIIIRSDIIDAEVMAAAPNLKIVVRAGAGYDNVDLKAATAHNVVVMNTPGQNSNAVAELALGMMVFQARGRFNGKSGTELKDKTLGIHAYGYVGKNIARIAKGFGMKVTSFDPFVDESIMVKDQVHPVKSVDDLYAENQYVSLNIPANDKTRNSIGFDLLSRMPKGATLVNTARKEVICEDGLMKMFAERQDFIYLTDVEPDCAAALKEQYPDRFFATPKKMGAQTSEANNNAGVAAAVQIVAFFEKGDVTFQVNK